MFVQRFMHFLFSETARRARWRSAGAAGSSAPARLGKRQPRPTSRRSVLQKAVLAVLLPELGHVLQKAGTVLTASSTKWRAQLFSVSFSVPSLLKCRFSSFAMLRAEHFVLENKGLLDAKKLSS